MPTYATAVAVSSPPTGCRMTENLSQRSLGPDDATGQRPALLAADGELSFLGFHREVQLNRIVVGNDLEARGLARVSDGERALPRLFHDQVIGARLVRLLCGIGLLAALDRDGRLLPERVRILW